MKLICFKKSSAYFDRRVLSRTHLCVLLNHPDERKLMHNCAKRNICISLLKLKIQVEHNDRLKKRPSSKKKLSQQQPLKLKHFLLFFSPFSSSNIDFFNKTICTATTHLVA